MQSKLKLVHWPPPIVTAAQQCYVTCFGSRILCMPSIDLYWTAILINFLFKTFTFFRNALTLWLTTPWVKNIAQNIIQPILTDRQTDRQTDDFINPFGRFPRGKLKSPSHSLSTVIYRKTRKEKNTPKPNTHIKDKKIDRCNKYNYMNRKK